MSDRPNEPSRVPVAKGQEVSLPQDDHLVSVLGNSLYPGANPVSIRLVLAWCKATGRDPMKKPIHIVPMYVKDAISGKGSYRDVLMPGIGTYRTDAANTGEYAGKSEPEFGEDIETTFTGGFKMMHPKWCRVTVKRVVAGQTRDFPAKEFWLENYATAGRDTDVPNAMWKKRPYGQLAKCAESQALRMAFPDETGNTNTAEEMEGKTFAGVTIDHTFQGTTTESEPVRDPAMVRFTDDTCQLFTEVQSEKARVALLAKIDDNLGILRVEAPELASRITVAANVAMDRLEVSAKAAPQETAKEPAQEPKREEPKQDAPKPPPEKPAATTPPPAQSAAPEPQPFSCWALDEIGEPVDPNGESIESAAAFVAWFETAAAKTPNIEGLREHNADALADAGADPALLARIDDAITFARGRLVPQETAAADPINPLFFPIPLTKTGAPHWPNYQAMVKPIIDVLPNKEAVDDWYDANEATLEQSVPTKAKVGAMLKARLDALKAAEPQEAAPATEGPAETTPSADTPPWVAALGADTPDVRWAWNTAQDLANAPTLADLHAAARSTAVTAKMLRLKAEAPTLFGWVKRAADEAEKRLSGTP